MTRRASLKDRITELILACERGRPVPEQTRDALIDDLASWQAERNPAYARLRRRGPFPPALPTEVFRRMRVATHPAQEDVRVFRSSGTTSAERSSHHFADLSLYDLAARVAAKGMLFVDVKRVLLVVLAPDERQAPQSSLSYMLSRFSEWFGSTTVWAWHDDALDLELLRKTLALASQREEPVALLGTSFAFVHAEDGLGATHFELPPGSLLMQTGGYKGRSREVDPATLRGSMAKRYGLPDHRVVAEYGMTEMSSQLYETTIREPDREASRRLWVPPWVRANPVHPETLQPVDGDTLGILRIDDCANLDSICCIQTADLARRKEDGIVVEGRAPGALARGCSLAADLALGPK